MHAFHIQNFTSLPRDRVTLILSTFALQYLALKEMQGTVAYPGILFGGVNKFS